MKIFIEMSTCRKVYLRFIPFIQFIYVVDTA